MSRLVVCTFIPSILSASFLHFEASCCVPLTQCLRLCYSCFPLQQCGLEGFVRDWVGRFVLPVQIQSLVAGNWSENRGSNLACVMLQALAQSLGDQLQHATCVIDSVACPDCPCWSAVVTAPPARWLRWNGLWRPRKRKGLLLQSASGPCALGCAHCCAGGWVPPLFLLRTDGHGGTTPRHPCFQIVLRYADCPPYQLPMVPSTPGACCA